MAIIGTITEDALEIELIPPKITNAENTVITTPVIQVSTPKLFSTAKATVLDCTELPIPNEATVAKKAKIIASHFHFKPRSM